MRTHTYRDGDIASVELLEPLPTWARLYSAVGAAAVLFGLTGFFVGLHLDVDNHQRTREPSDYLRLVLQRHQEKGALRYARMREAFPSGEPKWVTADAPRIRADACTRDDWWVTPDAMRRLAYVRVDVGEHDPPSSPDDAHSPERELLASAGLRLVSDRRAATSE